MSQPHIYDVAMPNWEFTVCGEPGRTVFYCARDGWQSEVQSAKRGSFDLVVSHYRLQESSQFALDVPGP
jgi:hypothetical protein